MSATLILAVAFVVTLIVAAVALDANLTLRAANRELREDNEGLRDEIRASRKAAEDWCQRATQGNNVTPSWVDGTVTPFARQRKGERR